MAGHQMVVAAVVALALALLTPSVMADRFGAAGHQGAEFVALGALPKYMQQCPKNGGRDLFSLEALFTEEERLGIYFGNWMRDFSQIVDPATVPCLPGMKTEDCMGRKDKFLSVRKHLEGRAKRVEKLTTPEEDDNILQKKLKSFIRKSAGKFYSDAAAVAKFVGLALEHRVTRKSWTRVGQILFQSKLEKMMRDHPQWYGKLAEESPDRAPLFVQRNVKGADGRLWPLGKFAVGPSEFGVYRLEEHIDNPDEYVNAKDKDLDFDKGCHDIFKTDKKGNNVTAGCSRVNINPKTKMKAFFDRSLDYMGEEFRAMVFSGRSEVLARKEGRKRDADLWKFEKLRHFGQAMHTLEDFFAHSNWIELQIRSIVELRAAKDKSLLRLRPTPWTASFKGEYPVVTGKFSSTDVLGSLLGIMDDKHHHKKDRTVKEQLADAGVDTCVEKRTKPIQLLEKIGVVIAADLMQEMATTPQEKAAAFDLEASIDEAVGPWWDGGGHTSDSPPQADNASMFVELWGSEEPPIGIRGKSVAQLRRLKQMGRAQLAKSRGKTNAFTHIKAQVEDPVLQGQLEQWLPALQLYCTVAEVGQKAKVFLKAVSKAVKALAKPFKMFVPTLRDVAGWTNYMQNWVHVLMWAQEGSNYGAAAEALKFYQWSTMEWLPDHGAPGDENTKQRAAILEQFKKQEGWSERKTISLEFSNPTHTQLSKDKEHHVLHKLARSLAQFCIRLMGEEFKRQEKNGWKEDEGFVSGSAGMAFKRLRAQSSKPRKPRKPRNPQQRDLQPKDAPKPNQEAKPTSLLEEGAAVSDSPLPLSLGLPGTDVSEDEHFEVLGFGSTSPQVSVLHKLLEDHKDILGLADKNREITDTGFGLRTEKAVRRFQKHRGIPATGVVDALTWMHLQSTSKEVAHLIRHPEPVDKMGPFSRIAAQIIRHPSDFDVTGADSNLKCMFDLVETWTDRQLAGKDVPAKNTKSHWSGNQFGALEILSAYDVQTKQTVPKFLDKLRDAVEDFRDRAKDYAKNLRVLKSAVKVGKKVKKVASQLVNPSALAIRTATTKCMKFTQLPPEELVATTHAVMVEGLRGVPEKLQDFIFFRQLKNKKNDKAFLKAFGLQRIVQCIAVRITDRQRRVKLLKQILAGLGYKNTKEKDKPEAKKWRDAVYAGKLDNPKLVHLYRRGMGFIRKEFPALNEAQKFFKMQVLTWMRKAVPEVKLAGWDGKMFAFALKYPPYKCGAENFQSLSTELQAGLVIRGVRTKQSKAVDHVMKCYEGDCAGQTKLLSAIAKHRRVSSRRGLPQDAAHYMRRMCGRRCKVWNKFASRLLKCNNLPLDALDEDVAQTVTKSDFNCRSLNALTAESWDSLAKQLASEAYKYRGPFLELMACCLPPDAQKDRFKKISKKDFLEGIEKVTMQSKGVGFFSKIGAVLKGKSVENALARGYLGIGKRDQPFSPLRAQLFCRNHYDRQTGLGVN